MCFETVVLTPATCHGRMNVKIEIGSCLVLPRFLYALLHLPATSPPGSHMDLEALHPHAAFFLLHTSKLVNCRPDSPFPWFQLVYAEP